MSESVSFKLNGKKVFCLPDDTILIAAEKAGTKIPALCYHPDLKIKANCRMCLVEIKGRQRLVSACSTIVVPGMEVFTASKKVLASRKENLKLLFAEHVEHCANCHLLFECELLRLAKEYKIVANYFPERKGKQRIKMFGGDALELNNNQCIDCRKF